MLRPEEEAALWPCHIPALEAFLSVQTQWRRTVFPMGGVIHEGLDYSAAEAGLRMAGIEVTPDLWQAVRHIEAGAKEVLNEG
ncbi:DUF1799 domain-containing protein [Donghicola sp.]|uniref:DUF1799 domain-containing protein n=1 Tax=Donghicola sp. TaxID=1929294 RepID=UPI0025D067BA|nr:DUF1799 domain-containing protein [Donghicola sp.]MCT4576888.1 DUF1799 domain-containing protein [Donghicola sp.]